MEASWRRSTSGIVTTKAPPAVSTGRAPGHTLAPSSSTVPTPGHTPSPKEAARRGSTSGIVATKATIHLENGEGRCLPQLPSKHFRNYKKMDGRQTRLKTLLGSTSQEHLGSRRSQHNQSFQKNFSLQCVSTVPLDRYCKRPQIWTVEHLEQCF